MARNLQFLLDCEDGSIVDDIGTAFVASANPLQKNHGQNDLVELKPGGWDIGVIKANRNEFVDLFVQHALYGSCKDAIDEFLRGWKSIANFPIIDATTHIEACNTLFCMNDN